MRTLFRLVSGALLLVVLSPPPVPAQEFSVNAHRNAPYKGFRFRVLWDGRAVPGLVRVSDLTRTTEVVRHRAGADAAFTRTSPGVTTVPPLRLERRRTHDTSFEGWANLMADPRGNVALASYRKDIVVQLLNEAGQIVMAFHVFACWPSEYTGLSQLAAAGAEVVTESLTLSCERWQRDLSVTEPAEPMGPPDG